MAGVRFQAGARFFSSAEHLDRLWGPPNFLCNGYPGLEADHSLPSNAAVKNGGAISPLFHMSSWHSA
jgi:hypothetical protein